MAVSKKELLKRWNDHCAFVKSSTTVTFSETAEEKAARIAHLKKDVKAMVEYYFPHYATAECAPFHIKFANAVKRNQRFKGHAEWGRGLAKSVWCDIIIPFWLWMNDECHYLVLIAKNEGAAKDLLMDLQAEFESNLRIIADFGEQKVHGSWEDGNFRTQGGFIGKALGMGQSVRGLRVGSQRPDMCVCDDLDDRLLVKNPKRQREIADWIEGALMGTMDGSLRRYLGANNKFAPNMIHDILRERHPNWYFHSVAAYDPVTYKPTWDKYPKFYYREIEEDVGTLMALAEYNNQPHVEGEIFKDEQIVWDKLPQLRTFKGIVFHWDIAYAGTKTADYNAVKGWGYHPDDIFWYIEGFVKQCKMRDAVRYMCSIKKKYDSKGIHIYLQYEAQFWNDEVDRTIKEVEREEGVKLNLVKVENPKNNKYDRILTLQPYYQNNRIRYNQKMKGDNDTQVGISQLKGIEPGYKGHDDSPDADEQAIKKLSANYKDSKTKVILPEVRKRFRH